MSEFRPVRERFRDKANRQALMSRGIVMPADLALWARKRGLLSVYIEWLPARGAYPGHWQVIRPGHKTDPEAPAWHRGNKTWVATSVTEKNYHEESARFWASSHFAVDDWGRVEGLGAALFPDTVLRELKVSVIPDLEIRFRPHRRVSQKRSSRRY